VVAVLVEATPVDKDMTVAVSQECFWEYRHSLRQFVSQAEEEERDSVEATSLDAVAIPPVVLQLNTLVHTRRLRLCWEVHRLQVVQVLVTPVRHYLVLRVQVRLTAVVQVVVDGMAEVRTMVVTGVAGLDTLAVRVAVVSLEQPSVRRRRQQVLDSHRVPLHQTERTRNHMYPLHPVESPTLTIFHREHTGMATLHPFERVPEWWQLSQLSEQTRPTLV